MEKPFPSWKWYVRPVTFLEMIFFYCALFILGISSGTLVQLLIKSDYYDLFANLHQEYVWFFQLGPICCKNYTVYHQDLYKERRIRRQIENHCNSLHKFTDRHFNIFLVILGPASHFIMIIPHNSFYLIIMCSDPGWSYHW